ncbi:hypothetical protein N3K66_008332 [Trichothecium roseum]|uniref:Uncharacterized protein n=1 Tax=Trichothecium roseum TaxID=47278 RepID=A0ACC0UR05_9HYPO|nr:hypothetical protein N3K66_008332 [Trichothecium roseum]
MSSPAGDPPVGEPSTIAPPSQSPPAPTAANAAIEVDTDGDSSYSASTGITDTESLRSSVLNYKWEHGRRYHAYGEGPYWGPNDERQQEAEDIMNEVFRIVLDGHIHKAPIGENPQAVLDVGCGTGIWAVEFADLYPSADVLGIDISPIQPSFIPPNCRFEIDDINKEWTFEDDEFDFIHIRYMTGTVADWPEFLIKAQRHLKPNGWIEHVELWGDARSDDGSLLPDSPLVKWVEIFKAVGKKLEKRFFWNSSKAFKEAGLVNVGEHVVKVPIGTWAKDKDLKQWGAWNRAYLLQGLEGFGLRALTEIEGWGLEEAHVFLADLRRQILDPKVHSYVLVTAVYGQKG